MTANQPTCPRHLTANAFTRTVTLQWLEHAAGGGGTAYADGATYSFSADITLYAQWTALPNHTVTFNANGGTGTMAAQTQRAHGPDGQCLYPHGYSFSGWNTAANGSGTAYANGATYSFSADITLFAQWTVTLHYLIVTSAATPSNATPNIGNTITVPVNINISGAMLGSYTASLDWDPAILSYQSYSGAPPTGFAGSVNTGNTATGHIAFNGANASGASGNIVVISITFNVVGSGTSALNLEYSAMAAASTFDDLKPYLTVTDGQVVVPGASSHTVTFNANGGTGTMAAQTASAPTALTANAYTRTGYTFSGWNTAANGSGSAYANGATYSFAADLLLYAQWTTSPSHTVTFNANGGTGTMAAQTASAPTALTANAYTRTGYTFSGWNTAANGSGTAYANGATYSFSADITLFAQWTATADPNVTSAATPSNATPNIGNTITVPININISGAALGSYTGTLEWNPDILAYQSYSGAPPTGFAGSVNTNDTDDGKITFNGANASGATGNTIVITVTFSVVGSGTSALDLNYSAMAAASTFVNLLPDLTITDGQVVVPAGASHTVTFSANGGTGTMTAQTANVPTALKTNTFTRTGYSFTGWNTAANGTGTAYANGATYSFAADLTLYAQWTALTNHTVTFSANGGTGTMTAQTANVPTALKTNTFTRTGYSFSGWNTAANGSGTAYANGATYSFAADLTLYAQWTALPNHTVTFNANGGSGTMTAQTANVPTALKANTFTRTGYTFSSWNTQANGNGTSYTDGATYSFSTNITLYAQWTALANHTVSFNANGGSGTMTAQTANVPTALKANTFTRTGYTFGNWNTQANGGGMSYAEGATYSFAADITLYAQWIAIPNHTVTFNANGGTGTMTSQSANVPTALKTNTFTRSGYSFGGWNTAAGGGGTAYTDGGTYSFAADITLFAQWTALPNHTVTFNANGGTGTMSAQSANVPTALTLNAFTRANYLFNGWNTALDGSGSAYANGAIYSFATDLTLYAQWASIIVTSAATPSNPAPRVGDTITVPINIDINGAALGSYTGTLDWDPAYLEYQSYTGAPPAGFTGNVNDGSAAAGHIAFNGANASGATGNTIVLTITFAVLDSGSYGLDLEYSAMAAASTFVDLLPYLTIIDGEIVIPTEPDFTVNFEFQWWNRNDGPADCECAHSFDGERLHPRRL